MQLFINSNNLTNNMKLTENDIAYITEKAVSKAQQRFMGMVHAYQKGELKGDDVSKSVKKAAKSMTKKAAKDFAKTKHKGLPNHVDEEFNISKKNIMLTEDPAGAPADPTMAGAAAAPAGDPNAMGQAPAQTDAAAQQGTASSTVNKERDASKPGWEKATGAFNPQGGEEEQQANNTNTNQDQQAAAQPQQAQAQQHPQQLSEADLKYISKKAFSIIKEWIK